MTFRRPESIHEGIDRARDILDRIEAHGQPVLPEEVFREARALACWIDPEGMALRIHSLLVMLEEQIAELPDVPDFIFALLLAAAEQAAQLADVIFAEEAIEHHLKKHELAEARAEQATAQSVTKRRRKAKEATT